MNVLHEDFDLTSALIEDRSGAVLREVKTALELGNASLRRIIDKGLAPAEFNVASNLQKACQQAQDIVETFWAQPRK